MKASSSQNHIKNSKKEIRASIQKKRDSLSSGKRHEKSLVISLKFIDLDYYKDSSRLLAYYPFRSEIDTKIIIKDALNRGKEIILPRVGKDCLELYYVRDLEYDLEPGSYDIMEPIPERCPQAQAGSIDLVIVPGVGFDRDYNRLGYGGGFYDRLLMEIPEDIPRIALAFDIQVVDQIPVSGHDLKIDMLITESFIL